MRAIVYKKYGKPEVVHIEAELDRPMYQKIMSC
jgi:hypothetical protein